MAFLRMRRQSEVVRIVHPDDPESWIELKAEFSKGEINSLGLVAPRETKEGEAPDRQGNLNFLESFFETAVRNWSLLDEDGRIVRVSRQAYRDLPLDAGNWVDEVLQQHIEKTLGKEIEAAEGKPQSSPTTSSSEVEAPSPS